MAELRRTHWQTREGEFIAVTGMDDQHLINTIRMLRRNAERFRMSSIIAIDRYLSTDPPDGATMCAESEQGALEEADADEILEDTVPTFPALLAEAEKRGLLEAVNAT